MFAMYLLILTPFSHLNLASFVKISKDLILGEIDLHLHPVGISVTSDLK